MRNVAIAQHRKAAPKKPSAKKKAPTGGPEVAPYLDSEALMSLGEHQAQRGQQKADAAAAFEQQAAQAYRGIQQAQLDRTKGLSHVEDNAAARGLLHSSIRDANLDTVDAAAALRTKQLKDELALSSDRGVEQERRATKSDTDFMNALAARAAELAAAVPREARAPSSAQKHAAAASAKRKGKNVRGSVTLRRGS